MGLQMYEYATYFFQENNLYHEVGVQFKNPDVPVFYFKANSSRDAHTALLVTFEKFTAGPPENFIFDVPQACQKRQ